MTFTLSGTTITQTGTDTDLSGLAGIAGVVHHSWSGMDIYDLDTANLVLVVQGSLSIGASNPTNSKEQLIIMEGNGAGIANLLVQGGTLNVGFVEIEGGDSEIITDYAMIFQPGVNKGYPISDGVDSTAAFRVVNGGVLNWTSGTIDVWGGIGTDIGTVANIGAGTKTKPVLDWTRARRPGTSQPSQILYGLGQLVVDGLKIKSKRDGSTSGAALVVANNTSTIKAYEPIFLTVAFSGSIFVPAGTYLIEDYQGKVGGGDDVLNKASSAAILKFLNSRVGSDITLVNDNDLLDPQGFQKFSVLVSGLFTGEANSETNGKVVVRRDDLSNPVVVNNGGSGSIDLGEIETFLFPDGIISADEKYFGPLDDTTCYWLSYDTIPTASFAQLRGEGGTFLEIKTSTDVFKTSDYATAISLTSTPTSQDVYNHFKALHIRDIAGTEIDPLELPFALSGDVLDVGPNSVILAAGTGEGIQASRTIYGFDTGTIQTTGTVTDAGAPRTISYGVTGGQLIINDASAQWTVSGNVVIDDIINNDAANNLVVNVLNGATVSTTEPGTGVGLVDLRQSVSISVKVLDTATGTPIQGARVYLEAGGSPIFNDLTDANGDISLVFNYNGDQIITGRVRKASTTPYYRTSQVSGTIASSGFSANVFMLLDQ